MVIVSSTFSVPAEGVLLQTPSTKLLINDQELGTATLYVTERNVVWGGGVLASGSAAPTITLQYQNIALHAIQREPSPALYMVLNYELRLSELTQPGSGDAQPEDDDDEYDGDNDPMTQLRFVPQNENELQAMYSALSQGQSLNPDPADVEDDDPYLDGEDFYEGDEEFEDAEELSGGAEGAAARLTQLNIHNGVHDDEDDEIGEE